MVEVDSNRWIGIAELRIEVEGLGVVLQGVRRCEGILAQRQLLAGST